MSFFGPRDGSLRRGRQDVFQKPWPRGLSLLAFTMLLAALVRPGAWTPVLSFEEHVAFLDGVLDFDVRQRAFPFRILFNSNAKLASRLFFGSDYALHLHDEEENRNRPSILLPADVLTMRSQAGRPSQVPGTTPLVAGWFGKRNNDRAGLGDWYPNPQKFPQGLKPLIDHVNGLRLDFGLWVEPEMVNPDSDLYRQHPAWVITFPDRPRSELRNVNGFARVQVLKPWKA